MMSFPLNRLVGKVSITSIYLNSSGTILLQMSRFIIFYKKKYEVFKINLEINCFHDSVFISTK